METCTSLLMDPSCVAESQLPFSRRDKVVATMVAVNEQQEVRIANEIGETIAKPIYRDTSVADVSNDCIRRGLYKLETEEPNIRLSGVEHAPHSKERTNL